MAKGGYKLEECKEVTFHDNDGRLYSARVLPVAQQDMVRPGIFEDGTPFEPDPRSTVPPTKPIATRALLVADPVKKGKYLAIPCVDLMINVGTDKQGIIWKYKRNVRHEQHIPRGPELPKFGFYTDGKLPSEEEQNQSSRRGK